MKILFFSFVLIGSLIIFGCNGNNKSEITESGTIEATDVIISSQVGATVKKVCIEEGSIVNKGDTLAVLDKTDYMLQLRSAESNYEMADAQYRLALRGAREEDIKQAEANYESAKNDFERMKELYASQSVTQKQYEDAQTRYTVLQQTLEKLKRGLLKEEIELAHARREQAAAQVELLKKRVNDCTILSPLSGSVTVRYIEPGELVNPGTAIAKISNLKTMNVTVYVSVTNLPVIRLGDSVKVKVDGLPQNEFEGKIVFISPSAEFTPKNVQSKEERSKLVFGVKVQVDNPKGELKAGLPADVVLYIRDAK